MMKKILLTAVALAGLSGVAAAQDAYNVGLTGALTGPAAGTYAPAVDGLRIYIDKVNAAGGVNGKKINLILLDDSAQPARAAANATRLVTDDKVVLLLNASLSSTYGPVVGESQKANIPLIFASSVCPKDVYPPAKALQFCTTAFAANYDSRAVLDFVKATAKGPVKLGLAAMAIPISRGEIDYAEELSKTLGMTPVSKQIIPPPTPDYTPFATLIKDADANWVYSWAPWVTQVRTLEGLRRLGWTGDYVAWAHLEAENELARLKDGKFFVVGANSLFQDDLPIHKEIAAAAKAAGSQYPVNQMTEGWIAGMVIEAALKASGWPANAEKITAALSNLKVDTKGLRGGTIEWTKDNHFRTKQYYRVYRWDEVKGAIVRVRDWAAFDVK
jgi:branched-chain amino acid transport system substrate-binding protein